MPEGTDLAQELLDRLGGGAPAGGAVTLISASFEDGSALAVRVTRAAGAPGHDEDEVAALLARPEDEPKAMAEVLLSTEYDPHGAARRIGLELFEEADSVPVRVAADREGEPVRSGEDGRRTASKMTFRFEGTRGSGLHEVVDAE